MSLFDGLVAIGIVLAIAFVARVAWLVLVRDRRGETAADVTLDAPTRDALSQRLRESGRTWICELVDDFADIEVRELHVAIRQLDGLAIARVRARSDIASFHLMKWTQLVPRAEWEPLPAPKTAGEKAFTEPGWAAVLGARSRSGRLLGLQRQAESHPSDWGHEQMLRTFLDQARAQEATT
jgi:hypothetical protein